MKLLVLTVSIVLAATASDALAAPLWSTPATGCVPIADSIQNNRYQGSNSGVAHAGTDIGTVTLICPVPTLSGSPDFLRMSFKDTYTTAGNAITATLYRTARATASTAFVATISSDSWDGVGTGLQDRSTATFASPFDYNTYFYWIKIEITRTSSANTGLDFHGVSIDAT